MKQELVGGAPTLPEGYMRMETEVPGGSVDVRLRFQAQVDPVSCRLTIRQLRAILEPDHTDEPYEECAPKRCLLQLEMQVSAQLCTVDGQVSLSLNSPLAEHTSCDCLQPQGQLPLGYVYLPSCSAIQTMHSEPGCLQVVEPLILLSNASLLHDVHLTAVLAQNRQDFAFRLSRSMNGSFTFSRIGPRRIQVGPGRI